MKKVRPRTVKELASHHTDANWETLNLIPGIQTSEFRELTATLEWLQIQLPAFGLEHSPALFRFVVYVLLYHPP